jgi:transcriptional regulator with XRE-family HTH domain
VVGANIRAHRLAQRLSQTELARHLGVSYQQLQKYEQGVNRVGAARLARVAAVLGVPVTSLLAGLDPGRRDQPSPLALVAHRHPLRLVQALAAIGDRRVRLALIEVAEGIARKTRAS